MINLDFSSVKSSSFEVLPAGDYTLEIDNVEEQTSKSGNQMLRITYKVAEGEHAGRLLFEYYVLTENALWKLQELFVALGIEANGDVSFTPDDLVGQHITGEIEIEESNQYGEQNRLKRHKKFSGVIL